MTHTFPQQYLSVVNILTTCIWDVHSVSDCFLVLFSCLFFPFLYVCLFPLRSHISHLFFSLFSGEKKNRKIGCVQKTEWGKCVWVNLKEWEFKRFWLRNYSSCFASVQPAQHVETIRHETLLIASSELHHAQNSASTATWESVSCTQCIKLGKRNPMYV